MADDIRDGYILFCVVVVGILCIMALGCWLASR